MGSQQLNPSGYLIIELLSNSDEGFLDDEIESTMDAVMCLMEMELVRKIKYKVGHIDDPIFKHKNIKYFTSLDTVYDIDKDYISYVPFLDNEIIYTNVEKPLGDLENHHLDIQLTDRHKRLYWKIPYYLNESSK